MFEVEVAALKMKGLLPHHHQPSEKQVR